MSDDSLIPLEGKDAYAKIENFPQIDFREKIPIGKRKIEKRNLDHIYTDLKKDTNGISKASIYDINKGLTISMFQKGGVTVAYTGDSLNKCPRCSIALEPIQFIANAFNREELKDRIKVLPGEKSSYEFGIEILKQQS